MKNQKKEINASSMADIAFLLLIFFLVTTTIDQDKGLLNRLPPIDNENISQPHHKRNVLEILINAENQLMVERKILAIEDLKEITKTHIENNGALPNFSEKPTKAIISLQNDRGTSYDMYLTVQNELKAAYFEIRNKEALMLSEQKYDYKALKNCVDLKEKGFEHCLDLKKQVKEKYPMIISEAEPFGQK